MITLDQAQPTVQVYSPTKPGVAEVSGRVWQLLEITG